MIIDVISQISLNLQCIDRIHKYLETETDAKKYILSLVRKKRAFRVFKSCSLLKVTVKKLKLSNLCISMKNFHQSPALPGALTVGSNNSFEA